MCAWYEMVQRLGQVNLTEADAANCDVDFWRRFWKTTKTQAVIVNAGGIVAYYPSAFAEQYRAKDLGQRDLFGEFVQAAHKEHIAIIARMDVNRVSKEIGEMHTDWLARHKDGTPFELNGRYQCCVNGMYYQQQVPLLLREIIERYHPDGFADNSWTGPSRTEICYCDCCRDAFMKECGEELPSRPDYQDRIYRHWIRWSYGIRMRNWDLFHKTTTNFGGKDCLWIGMINANFVSGHASFCDLREVAKRSRLMLVDHQSRDGNGFEQNSLNGLLLHQLAGWKVPIAESMATYVRGLQTYRRSANPPLETELWMAEGVAGGLLPWWHIVGALQQDKRLQQQVAKTLRWHVGVEKDLVNDKPLASVGVIWSQSNVEFFGREHRRERIEHSFRGITKALLRAGISFVPIHANDIESQSSLCELLILPEMGVLSLEQVAALEQYQKRGKNILVIGHSGQLDETGELWQHPLLETLLGVRFLNSTLEDNVPTGDWEKPTLHNYLRIEQREHPAFIGFEQTAILPMGGTVQTIVAKEGTRVLASYIPTFAIYPPEASWPTVAYTKQPVLTERSTGNGGRCIYVAWDLDASYGRCGLPDHGDLLGNLVRDLLGDKNVATVKADGYVDMKCYRQRDRIAIHLVNLSVVDHGFAERCIPLGNIKIQLKVPRFTPTNIHAMEMLPEPTMNFQDGMISIQVALEEAHRLLLIEGTDD